jgi:hypothetical protein
MQKEKAFHRLLRSCVITQRMLTVVGTQCWTALKLRSRVRILLGHVQKGGFETRNVSNHCFCCSPLTLTGRKDSVVQWLLTKVERYQLLQWGGGGVADLWSMVSTFMFIHSFFFIGGRSVGG